MQELPNGHRDRRVRPNLTEAATTGPIRFSEWIGGNWAFFFSRPADFNAVCTTEVSRTAQLAAQVADRRVKPIGLSTDTDEEHLK